MFRQLIATPPPKWRKASLARVHLRLEEILGCKVDVATEGGMRPRYRERIEDDLIYVSA
jgi:predicted nucleotidyltransferase